MAQVQAGLCVQLRTLCPLVGSCEGSRHQEVIMADLGSLSNMAG